MPESPWRTFGSPDPNGAVALFSYGPLKSYWRILPLVVYAKSSWRLRTVCFAESGDCDEGHRDRSVCGC